MRRRCTPGPPAPSRAVRIEPPEHRLGREADAEAALDRLLHAAGEGRDVASGQTSLDLRVANRWLSARREPVRDGEHDVAAGLVRLETAVAVPERALLGRERHDLAGPGIDGPDAHDRVGDFLTVRADVLDRCGADEPGNSGEALEAG